jgi:hypothetical protein
VITAVTPTHAGWSPEDWRKATTAGEWVARIAPKKGVGDGAGAFRRLRDYKPAGASMALNVSFVCGVCKLRDCPGLFTGKKRKCIAQSGSFNYDTMLGSHKGVPWSALLWETSGGWQPGNEADWEDQLQRIWNELNRGRDGGGGPSATRPRYGEEIEHEDVGLIDT